MYCLFFPDVFDVAIPRSYNKYASLECAGERFGSQFSRVNRCSFILAKWAARFDGEVDMRSDDLRPGIVQLFGKQSIVVRGKRYTFCFARVDWFHLHPNRSICGTGDQFPEVWCANQFVFIQYSNTYTRHLLYVLNCLPSLKSNELLCLFCQI